jgi:hypothetical protein
VTDPIQITGALLILVPFVWSQLGGLAPESLTYLAFNLVGSVLLALLAARTEQWGFFALEVTWAMVSLLALLRLGVDDDSPRRLGRG